MMKRKSVFIFLLSACFLQVNGQIFSLDANYFSEKAFPSVGFGVRLTPYYLMRGEVGFGNLGANHHSVGIVRESGGSHHSTNGSEPPCIVPASYLMYNGSYFKNYYSTYSGINCSWINSFRISYKPREKKKCTLWANFGLSWTKVKDEIKLEYISEDQHLLRTESGTCNFNALSFDPALEFCYLFTTGFGIKARAGYSFYFPFENGELIGGTTGINLFSGKTPKFQLGISYELYKRK